MNTFDTHEERSDALKQAFLARRGKDKLDSAIVLCLSLQDTAASVHDALPIGSMARRRAAEAYLIARGTVAIVSDKWLYSFADEEVRPFTNNSALLCEFRHRISRCNTRDDGASCVERITGNIRQILDEPSLRAVRQEGAA